MNSQISGPELSESLVHIWAVHLQGDHGRYAATLSEDENARAERFYFDRDRNRFAAGRHALRHLLSGYLGLPAPQIEFSYSKYGKPDVKHLPEGLPLRFNVSHCEQWALIGLTLSHRVGVDIERIRLLDDVDGMARSCFSSRELDQFLAVPADRKAEAFFNCWTRKEAFVKACGEGLSHPLQDFDVTLVPDEPAEIQQVRGKGESAGVWSLADLRPVPGYVGAAVVEQQEVQFVMAGLIKAEIPDGVTDPTIQPHAT